MLCVCVCVCVCVSVCVREYELCPHGGEKKKIHDSWEDVSGYFPSRQLKGGGIDGRVGPRTGDSDRIVPDPLSGHTS